LKPFEDCENRGTGVIRKKTGGARAIGQYISPKGLRERNKDDERKKIVSTASLTSLTKKKKRGRGKGRKKGICEG